MDGFEWAENNLDAKSPDQLQDEARINVYFAPNIAPETKVVNLADGRVEFFAPDEPRPLEGYYAEFESLERFCLREGTPLSETEGFVSVLPHGRVAGDPLKHGDV